MAEKISVFVVDDHKLFRDTLKWFLESRDNIRIAGEAGKAAQAVEEVLRLQPDVVLMDLSLPDFDGIEATAQIIALRPQVRIIAVTMHAEQLYLLKFLEAGGVGYVHKSAAAVELHQAIEQVHRGQVYLSTEGVQVVASRFRLVSNRPEAELLGAELPEEDVEDIPPHILSARERQVLGLISRGYSSREVGAKIFLSSNTVESYRRRIGEKLNLHKKSDLVAYAIRHNILGDPLP